MLAHSGQCPLSETLSYSFLNIIQVSSAIVSLTIYANHLIQLLHRYQQDLKEAASLSLRGGSRIDVYLYKHRAWSEEIVLYLGLGVL